MGHAIAGVGSWLHRELVAARPVFLFFLGGFLFLLLLIKLVAAEYSIEVKALSTAAVGALIAAKAVLILDETPLARRLERNRRIVAIVVKTLFYGAATFLIGCLERVLEARHKLHGLGPAAHYVIDHANRDRMLAWVLGISIVFGLYFMFDEIEGRMGEGALWRLLFQSPTPDATRIAANR